MTVRQAIEEILRWDPPLQWFERWVLDDDVELGGAPLANGSRVALVIGAANRDPRQFPDPDRFDIAREDTNHISFGGGIHFCIGAPLARMELEMTLNELARARTSSSWSRPPLRRPTFQFRGYERLEIALHVARGLSAARRCRGRRGRALRAPARAGGHASPVLVRDAEASAVLLEHERDVVAGRTPLEQRATVRQRRLGARLADGLDDLPARPALERAERDEPPAEGSTRCP